MSEVRDCQPADLSDVARLFVKAFHGRPGQSLPAISDYLRTLYFENPWVDPALPSIVAERDAVITGFIGVMPLPIRFDGRPLRLAIGGNLMVDPDERDPMVAMRVLRRYFAGAQDVSFTDTASPQAMRLWAAQGGAVARFHSMRWFIPLRPGSLGLAAMRRSSSGSRLAWLGHPLAVPLDWFARRRLGKESDLSVVHVDVERVRSFVAVVGDRGYAHVDADLAGWTWLVDMCRAKTQFGPLHLLAFVDRSGQDVGVVMYYPNQRGLGQAVLVLARENAHGDVFDALCREAADQGSAALVGQADPRLMEVVGDRASCYIQRHGGVTVRCTDDVIRAKIASGDVALNRLIGEFWTRMQGDDF